MPSRRFNRILWIIVVALIGIFAMRAQDVIDLALSGIGKLDVRYEPEAATLHLRWRGKIEAPMAQKISQALDQYGGDASRIVLSLSSPGGALDHGAEVIGLLRRAGQSRRLETVVEGRGMCASMCVPIYLQGEVRRASAGSRFMFHEVSYRESLSDETVDVPGKAIATATDRFFDKYFLSGGVPRDWLAGIRASVAGGHDVWKTGSELVRENSGIVQQLE